MKRLRNAKIIATLGPASSSLEAICTLFENGADVFRLNFSHGSHDDHRKLRQDQITREKIWSPRMYFARFTGSQTARRQLSCWQSHA